MANQATEVATTAADQGKQVAATTVEETKQVAGQAMEQVQAVAGEAKAQARTLLDQARTDVKAQADQQTDRIAEGLRGLAGQVQALLDGRTQEAGPLPDMARQATSQLEAFAGRLGDGGLDGVVDDVTRFARRKPGLFLAGAAALGFVGGRLLRGAQAAQQQGLGQPEQPRLAGATADADEVITLTQAPTTHDTIAVPVGGAS
jgi:hypothetical protein